MLYAHLERLVPPLPEIIQAQPPPRSLGSPPGSPRIIHLCLLVPSTPSPPHPSVTVPLSSPDRRRFLLAFDLQTPVTFDNRGVLLHLFPTTLRAKRQRDGSVSTRYKAPCRERFVMERRWFAAGAHQDAEKPSAPPRTLKYTIHYHTQSNRKR